MLVWIVIQKQVQADVRSYSSSMTFDPGLQSRRDPLLHLSDAKMAALRLILG